ncbi:MAG TPA: aminotransferase class I/II-fold pyridoxal phosphate-dependent enzyme [Phaeodactylibacter sp.]|nr:aminotransferase class I/II-fold pyridoxal phosphate-dependent enzyme [Phaeodactylibacter sp.]
MLIQSKLPNVGTTIFTIMSALAREHQAINLSQGFPDFDCPQALKDSVNFHMQSGKNQYVPMAGVPILRKNIALKMRTLYGHPIDADTDITITAGATQALFTAITALVHKGDEVILIEPAYDCYRPTIELVGAIPVAYELTAPSFRIDWDKFAGLLSERTKMIIINTPHNPVGKVLSADDMLALQKLTKGTDIVVLSDEVYEHLIYDGKEHQTVLRYPELFKRSLLVYSFGKTYHNTGWKIGYCIAPEYLMKEFRKVHQFNVFSANSFVQYGIADFMEDSSFYLRLPTFYQAKRDFFVKAMQGSRLRPLGCEGTYFQLYDYSGISNVPDTAFAKILTKEHGVAAIPVSVFYASGRDDKVIRLCFAKTEEVLSLAGQRLRKL